MTNSQLKTVKENIFSIREVAMELLQSSDSHMIELANVLSDRVTDIEIELYGKDMLIYGSQISCKELWDQNLSEPEVMTNISEDDFRELLVVMEYKMLKENHPKQYELASEEEQVEEWVYAMDKQDLQVEANKLGYRVI